MRRSLRRRDRRRRWAWRLTGCGGTDKQAAVPVDGFDSAYCVTARKWAVHELNGGGDGALRAGRSALH
jgi:hypothetical protein